MKKIINFIKTNKGVKEIKLLALSMLFIYMLYQIFQIAPVIAGFLDMIDIELWNKIVLLALSFILALSVDIFKNVFKR